MKPEVTDTKSAAAESDGSTTNDFRCAACIVGVLVLAIFFRQFLTSHFDLIDGNIGDNRFVIAILEHWRAVFRGEAAFRSPNFFWPERGALGYSDCVFLLFPPYAAGRATGLDPYLAFEMSLISFKAIGFFATLWLLRSILGVTRPVALVGSVLFTLSNLYFVSAGHGHLMTVDFVPLLTCLACAAWKENAIGRKATAYSYGSAFGLLLALVLFTSFYIGWFTLLAGALVLLSFLIIRRVYVRSTSPLREGAQLIISNTPLLAVTTVAFAISITPFLMTYLPTLKRTGGRSFQENLPYMAQPIDLFNIGQLNWMWGRQLERVLVWSGNKPIVPSEVEKGWPPFTLLVFATGFLLSVQKRSYFGGIAAAPFDHRRLVVILSLAFLVGWLLSIKVHEFSLWWFVFKFVPGGTAIRVPARFNLVLNILVVLSTTLLLNDLNKRSKFLFWMAALILTAEQINMAPVHGLERMSENAILERAQRPPSNCSSFFLDAPASLERPWYANQIDAMLVARMFDLPTLNGYSGWLPVNWPLASIDDDSADNARVWAASHRISAGVCGLNMRDGSWTGIDLKLKPYVPGSVIDFRLGGNAKHYKADGWGNAEEGGAWTLGDHSVLLLNLPDVPVTDLLLTFKAHAFLVPKRPRFGERLRINDRDLTNWTVASSQFERQVSIPRAFVHSRLLKIDFIDQDPKSPAELGYSADSRQLGLAMETLSLKPINQP